MNRQDARVAKGRPPVSWRLGVLAVLSISAWPSSAVAAGAVDSVAQEVTQSLGQTPGAPVVVAAPLVSDVPAPKGDDLAVRVAALVAGRIGAGAKPHPQAAALSTARAIAGRASALVFVQTELAKGDLRTTIDVYPSMANAWDRIRNPLPAPTGHAFATAKIDAEVRAFLAPLVLEQASVHKVHHDEGDVIAAACGDVDGDGGDEIVLVSRARVSLGRVRGGRYVAEHTAAWSTLSPKMAVPMRDPLASAVITDGAVHVGFTDRGWMTLTPDFVGHTTLLGMPAWGGDGLVCLMAEPSAGAYDGAPFDCAHARDVKPRLGILSARYDAIAAATIVDPGGEAHPVAVAHEPGGKLKMRMGDAPVRSFEMTFGAQLAVADLDQDGVPEIATSVDGAEDAVNVFSWAAANADPRGRLHLAAPGGVRALAACPAEDRGEPVLVAVVGAELWLVRAGVRGAAGETGEAPARPAKNR
jgi:hypothetical protein